MKTVSQDLEQFTSNGNQPNENDVIQITGSKSIDRTIFGLHPEIANLSEDRIIKLGNIINTFIFGEAWIIDIIKSITSSEIIDYLEGVKTIIKNNEIKTIEDFEANINDTKRELRSSIICD